MNNKVDFDQYTHNYNDLLHEGTKFFTSNEEYFAKYKIDFVRAQVDHGVTRILEYGCGIGRNIPYLQSAFPGAEVVGTDISEASLEIAKSENPEARIEVEKPGLDLGQFDLIFVAGVFHHIAPVERPAVANLLATRLTGEGTLNVFEHNPYNPVTRKIVNDCPFDADAVLLKPSELKNLYDHAMLETIGHSYCLFVPPRLSWLVPLEKYLAWMPLGGQYCSRARHKK